MTHGERIIAALVALVSGIRTANGYLTEAGADTQGYGVEFGIEHYHALADVMRTAKGKVILSINDHPLMREVFGAFRHEQLNITYSMGNASGRGAPRSELIVMSW